MLPSVFLVTVGVLIYKYPRSVPNTRTVANYVEDGQHWLLGVGLAGEWICGRGSSHVQKLRNFLISSRVGGTAANKLAAAGSGSYENPWFPYTKLEKVFLMQKKRFC